MAQALHEAGVTQPLVALLRTSQEYSVRSHAAMALERMVAYRETGATIQSIVALHAAEGMIELLRERTPGMGQMVRRPGAQREHSIAGQDNNGLMGFNTIFLLHHLSHT